MAKIISVKEAMEMIHDEMSIMIGGFLAVGTPEILVDALVEKNTKNHTLIAISTAYPNKGSGKLVVNKQVKKAIVSHIGTNPEAGKQYINGELEIEFVPQGTLVERIRCGGFGLGGVLTPTGIGTEAEDEKERIKVNGQVYLLETPLKADIALLCGAKVDKKGNVFYNATARNFNPLMAMAAETVIIEAEEIVEIGDIDPNCVATPFKFINFIVGGAE